MGFKVRGAGSGFVTEVPEDSEGSAGSNLGPDPLASPQRPWH